MLVAKDIKPNQNTIKIFDFEYTKKEIKNSFLFVVVVYLLMVFMCYVIEKIF